MSFCYCCVLHITLDDARHCSREGARPVPASSSLRASSPRQWHVPMAQLLMDATCCAAAVHGEHQPRWCPSPRPARPCSSCAHRHARRHGRHGAAVLYGSRTDAGGWTDTLCGGTQRCSSSQACAWDVARGAVRQVALGIAATSCALALFLAAPTPGTAAALVPPPEAPAASVSTSISDKELYLEAWRLVDDNYLGARRPFDRVAWAAVRDSTLSGPLRSRAAAHSAIARSLESLGDRYTRFVETEDFPALTRYDISGVGLNLGDDPTAAAGLRVLGVVLDSLAAQAGVRQDDQLVAVDGASVAGMTPFQAASLIQSKPRSEAITLTVAHGSAAATTDVVIPPAPPGAAAASAARSPVDAVLSLLGVGKAAASTSPVTARLEAGSVGVLTIREFNGVTARDAGSALERLRAAGATSFVLDLRDCPGGLVSAGVEVARLFLPPDSTVAFAAGRVQAAGGLAQADAARRAAVEAGAVLTPAAGPDLQLKRVATDAVPSGGAPPPRLEAPLTVLVNGRTASAAEIVAGALRDNCRAPLVGARTFGKGLIQSVYELSDGSGVVMTVGTYVRPNGDTIDQRGLAPDFATWPGTEAAQQALETCVRAPSQMPPRGGP